MNLGGGNTTGHERPVRECGRDGNGIGPLVFFQFPLDESTINASISDALPLMLISQDLVLDLDVRGSPVADHARAQKSRTDRAVTTDARQMNEHVAGLETRRRPSIERGDVCEVEFVQCAAWKPPRQHTSRAKEPRKRRRRCSQLWLDPPPGIRRIKT